MSRAVSAHRQQREANNRDINDGAASTSMGSRLGQIHRKWPGTPATYSRMTSAGMHGSGSTTEKTMTHLQHVGKQEQQARVHPSAEADRRQDAETQPPDRELYPKLRLVQRPLSRSCI